MKEAEYIGGPVEYAGPPDEQDDGWVDFIPSEEYFDLAQASVPHQDRYFCPHCKKTYVDLPVDSCECGSTTFEKLEVISS